MKSIYKHFFKVALFTLMITMTTEGKAITGNFVIVDGCAPAFWKDNTSKWLTTGFLPGQSVRSVFNLPFYHKLGHQSLLQAVLQQSSRENDSRGKRALKQAEKDLLRVAVAALLNSAHPDVDFPTPTSIVIEEVNTALASRNRNTILQLIALLKELDEGLFPCPLD